LTHFAILLSALTHDVDHPGVSKMQLVKETNNLAVKYNNQSVDEQNFITLGWELLMQPNFVELRSRIAPNWQDLVCLRQFIVNLLMATDLFDADL
jgi:3'5'-cyclic nucleotide phosphodiesterase